MGAGVAAFSIGRFPYRRSLYPVGVSIKAGGKR
jgi:hypothetical protein